MPSHMKDSLWRKRISKLKEKEEWDRYGQAWGGGGEICLRQREKRPLGQ